MEKHYGFLESLDKFQEGHEHKFCMPAHSGRFISPEFLKLIERHGIRGIESSIKALSKANGYQIQDGVLGDLGPLYHESFNSCLTLLLQNGSTLGNHIVSYCLAGKKVLIQSNSHLSIQVGLQMSGARIYYVQPDYDKEYDMLLPIKPQQIQACLSDYPDIQVIYLTNPTYDGLCFNIEEMKKVCGERIFIVDEAHGAHFYFIQESQFPKGALNNGADVAITSVHKTLGGISGTALINVAQGSKMDVQRIKMQHMMMSAMADSVSPFILADLEGCVREFNKNGQQLISQALQFSKMIKETIKSLQGFKLADFSAKYPNGSVLQDPLKIVFKIDSLRGPQIWDILESRYKINIEKTTQTTATITVHSHLNQNDVDVLINALKELNDQTIIVDEGVHNSSMGPSGALIDESSFSQYNQLPLYKQVLNDRDLVLDIRDCFAGESEMIPLNEALGRISCEIKYACPPGFPILLYGERIQESHIKLFGMVKSLEEQSNLMIKVMIQSTISSPSSIN